jgi:hypothetical protein
MSPEPDCRFDRMCRAGGIPQIKHANHARQRVADCRRDAWLAIVLRSNFAFAWRVTRRAAQVLLFRVRNGDSRHKGGSRAF